MLISAVNSLISAAVSRKTLPSPPSKFPFRRIPILLAMSRSQSLLAIARDADDFREVDIELPVELPSPEAEAASAEVAAPIALGIDAQDAEVLAPDCKRSC